MKRMIIYSGISDIKFERTVSGNILIDYNEETIFIHKTNISKIVEFLNQKDGN